MPRIVRSIPFRGWLLLLLLVLHAISAINPENYQDFVFEHIPTATFLVFIFAFEKFAKRGPLSNTSYILLFVFMAMHILGAHYLYSNVPYDRWSQAIFGSSINELFGWERNHYDRFVHLMFGVLMVRPTQELVQRAIPAGLVGQLVISVLVLSFLSVLYEWAEWVLTMTVSPEAAENYNGQQGDMFDAQKDTALAFVGSVAAAGLIFLRSRRRSGHPSSSVD